MSNFNRDNFASSMDIEKTLLTDKASGSVLEINYGDSQLLLDGKPVFGGRPSPRRFEFMYELAKAEGRPVSRTALTDRIQFRSEGENKGDRLSGYKFEILGSVKKLNENLEPFIVSGSNHSYRLNADCYSIQNTERPREDTRFIPPANMIEPTEFMKTFRAFFDRCNREQTNNVISLTGDQGIGKTTFIHYFCSLLRDPEQNILLGGSMFKKCIAVSYSDRGLEHTIASLDTGDNPEDKDRSCRTALAYLRKLPKPALLVIDNYNNPGGFRDEISGQNSIFTDLLETGCRIIIVSNNDLSGCYAIRQIEYPGLKEDLYRLFINECRRNRIMSLPDNPGEEADFEKKAKPFIRNSLKSNTYLTVLFVQLLKNHSLDNVIRAFSTLEIDRLGDYIAVNKDNRMQAEMPLLDHYRSIFALGRISENEYALRLICVLSLVPADGINSELLYSLAFEEDLAPKIRKAQVFLEKSRWVFLDRGMLSIKPIIRELVVTDYLTPHPEYVGLYLHELNRISVTDVYHSRLPEYLLLTEEACLSMKKALAGKTFKGAEFTYLTVNCAQNNDILRRYRISTAYGREALALLDDLVKSGEEPDSYSLAVAYNRAVNAMQHIYETLPNNGIENPRADFPRDALLEGFQKGLDLAYSSDNPENFIIATKIRGNMGAVYLAAGDYDKAYEVFCEVLGERNQLYISRNSGSRRDEISTRLLANSCRQLGTLIYHEAMKPGGDKYQNLKLSLEYHWGALALYGQFIEKNMSEYYVEANRFAGTGLQLLKNPEIKTLRLAGRFVALPEKQVYRKGLAKLILSLMTEAQDYFKTVNRLEKELRITRENIKKLKELTAAESQVSG